MFIRPLGWVIVQGPDTSAYTAVLFDCPPNLGRALYSVLIAADAVVAVTEPAYDSVRGVGRLEEMVRGVARRCQPALGDRQRS